MISEYIEVIGAREHNLKNINVKIPKNKLVAITGPSGSGKSTFAMDILQRECQRQYLESMGMVTDGLNKPNVDQIIGLSPAIGISQRQLSGNKSSTVGTYTEILTYLRILYSKIGIRTCKKCGKAIELNDQVNDKIQCTHCETEYESLTMGTFSFNKVEGACKTCKGHGEITDIDLSKVVNENLTLAEGAVTIWSRELFGKYYCEILEKCGDHYGFTFDSKKIVKDFNELERLVFYKGVDSEEFKALYPDIKKPKKVNDGYFKGILTFMKEKAYENSKKEKKNSKITSAFVTKKCSECGGSKLGFDGRTVKVKGLTLPHLCSYDMKTLLEWLNNLELNEREAIVVKAVVSDLKKRIGNLIKIGLTYLSLERSVGSLSGGEAQRLKLSNIIDSGLTGVLYILDEPTSGLHPHDGKKLLDALKFIRDLGNTVLVIEHDMDFVNACDYVIDFGPESGVHGGEIIAHGKPIEIVNNLESVTGKYLNSKVTLTDRAISIKDQIQVTNAYAHNLNNVNVSIPLNTFVCFTGVSGSGKSSLVFDVINKYFENGKSECDSIKGVDLINRVVHVNQKPIGRLTRSNVATYTKVYTLIRELFSKQTMAKIMNCSSSSFSFNVKGGRCEHCQGMGVITLDMQFLDDVEIECSHCGGKRFKQEVLDVVYRDKNISDVLNMTVDQAILYFQGNNSILKILRTLNEVGLGYLKLGQSTSTLSGGECQRIKLSRELANDNIRGTLYILDEPTTGLHPKDIEKIIKLLYKLKDNGNSIFLIEHSLDVVAKSEYIIDLGPEGGTDGGSILATGKVKDLIKHESSYTGKYLRMKYLEEAI